MNRDLTVGDPGKVIRRFCLPLFGSIFFQQLYNVADSLIVGKYVGENALAAVGNSYEVTLIFIAIAVGCNIGCSVVVSRFFGAKEYSPMKTAVYTTFIASGVICAVLMLLGFVFTNGLLGLINTPEELMADSVLYLQIYLLGLPFLFFYNISTGIFNALGDSKTPFIFLACSSSGNVIADIIFVNAFKLGVAGVAWATFLCQGISCILSMWVIVKRVKKTCEGLQCKYYSTKILRQITRIAVPSMLQQSFISVGNIIIQGVINSFGAGVIAGYAAGIKLNNLVVVSLTTVGNGISNYTSQNLGAGKIERVREGFAAGYKFILTMTIPMVILYEICGRSLIAFFITNPSQLALDTGCDILRILAPMYCFVAIKSTTDGIHRGSGFMGRFMTGTLVDLFLRVTLSIFLSKTRLGATGIWWSWPFAWGVSIIISYYFYSIEYCRKTGGQEEQNETGA